MKDFYEQVKLVADTINEDHAMIFDMAKHIGDQVHEVLKRNGMLMPSVAAAMGMGCVAAAQLLTESVLFAEKSMEGDEEDAAIVKAAGFSLFVELIEDAYPGALASALERITQED